VQKLIEPRIITLSEYFEHFKKSLSPKAEFYAKKSASDEKGLLFGAFRGGIPYGALSAGLAQDGGYSIFYVETIVPYRKQGVSNALLNFALSGLKSSGLDIVETGVSLSLPFYETVDYMLKKNGFKETKTLTTVINQYNDENIADFYDFKRTRGDKLAARFIGRGYSAKSFAESSEREIQDLKDGAGVSFPAALSPFRSRGRVLKDFSFIIFKDGRPAAYCVMSEFENIPSVSWVSAMASSSEARHSGVAIWALLKCLEESIASKKFTRTLFTFDSDNLEMANLKDKPPTRFKGSQSALSRVYRLRLRDWGGAS
jgi:hypothetical protein